jgi:hypothetical protein
MAIYRLMCQDHGMPKDRKQTYSDRQSQAARDEKQAQTKTPLPEVSTPAAAKPKQKALRAESRKGK